MEIINWKIIYIYIYIYVYIIYIKPTISASAIDF